MIVGVVNVIVGIVVVVVGVVVEAVVNKFTPVKAPAEQFILIVITMRVEELANVIVEPAGRSDTTIIVDN